MKTELSRRWFFSLTLCWLASCSSGGSIMTMNSFHEIPVGASQEEVISSAGEPYNTRKLDDGSVEYEYIERFKAGGRNINERHYFIVMKEGKVVSKRVGQVSPLPYGFDSYDMQTTQNGGSPPPASE